MVAYGLGRWAAGKEVVITKRQKETFKGNGYVYYLDYGGSFTGIYIYQNFK